jgi:predicted PurR-regulated permease PerM
VKTVLFLFVVWLLVLLRDVVLIVLTAITIASALEPGVALLVKRKIPRTIAVIFIYLALFGLVFSVIFYLVPSVLEDVSVFMASLPSYISHIAGSGFFDQYTSIFGIPTISITSSDQLIAQIPKVFSNNTVGDAFSAARGVFGGVFSAILIIVFSFYFAVIETGVDDFLRVVVPKHNQPYVLGLWRRSQHKIGLWMQGQLLLGLIMGVLVFLGLTILGVQHALILALIAAITEIIPVFGPTLAAIPAITIATVSGGLTLGVLTLGLFVIAQQFENHLIYPLVVTRVVGIPPLLVILALIIGAQLAGFLGIILSVPVAATLREFIRDWEHDRVSVGSV